MENGGLLNCDKTNSGSSPGILRGCLYPLFMVSAMTLATVFGYLYFIGKDVELRRIDSGAVELEARLNNLARNPASV